MQYVEIPKTDLKTAAIVMGSVCCVEGPVDDAYRMMDMYRAAGGNMLDSANVYGKFFAKGTNICDEHIGNWLKSRKCRNEFLVVSKGGHPDPKGDGSSRLRKEDIRHDLEESLRSLGTDVIDLYYLHRDDVNVPVGEIIEYMNEFKGEGLIRFFGASNWCAKRVTEGVLYAEKHDLEGFVADQTLWSMAKPVMEYYPWSGCTNMDGAAWDMHCKSGMMAFAYESQARGFFQKYGKYGLAGMPEQLRNLYGQEENIRRYELAEKIAQEKEISLAAIGILYLLGSPFPSAALIGPRTLEQFEESMQAADLKLSEDEIRMLRNA